MGRIQMTEAEKLLLHIYNNRGPRDRRWRIYPAKRYAKLSLDKVNTKWDFEGRVLMHEIATLLYRPRKAKKRA